VRAVASAGAANTLAVAMPCHRVGQSVGLSLGCRTQGRRLRRDSEAWASRGCPEFCV